MACVSSALLMDIRTTLITDIPGMTDTDYQGFLKLLKAD